jgi:hypothetical protein
MSQYCCLITAPRPNLKNRFSTSAAGNKFLAHQRDDKRLRNSLLITDRQRYIFIGTARKGLIYKPVARNAPYGG